MNSVFYFTFALLCVTAQAKLHSQTIDSKELKCLVCITTLNELNEAIAQIDPTHKIDIGGYRIDPKGNLQQKQVLKSKSEIHLSELAGDISKQMDNYIRGTWKDDGSLTVFKLIENGQMSPKFSLVDIIQDDDLNKSLKYYSEEIIQEHEEQIIKYHIDEVENITETVCKDYAKYCTADHFIEKEHIVVPGSENDFAEQLESINQQYNANNKDETVEEDTTEEDTENVDVEGADFKDEL